MARDGGKPSCVFDGDGIRLVFVVQAHSHYMRGSDTERDGKELRFGFFCPEMVHQTFTSYWPQSKFKLSLRHKGF
jgi:hypothetical protein